MSARSLLAVLAVLAAIAVTAGCGSDDLLSSHDVAQAADKTAAKGGSRIAMNQTITLPGEPTVSTTASGVIDSKGKRGHIKLDLSNVPGFGKQAGGNLSQDVIFEGFTVYMRSPAFARLLPDGKRWLKFDLNKATKATGIDLEALSSGSQDPAQGLQYLRAASGDVKRVGEEDVRGVKTTHYKATVDLRRYPDTAPARNRAAIRRSIGQMIKLSGTSKLPMEVWIDKDDVVRRLKQTIRTEISPSARTTMVQTVDLYDFGTPVDVDVPSDDETQDATELATKGSQQSTE
jgi:hypothetical protein